MKSNIFIKKFTLYLRAIIIYIAILSIVFLSVLSSPTVIEKILNKKSIQDKIVSTATTAITNTTSEKPIVESQIKEIWNKNIYNICSCICSNFYSTNTKYPDIYIGKLNFLKALKINNTNPEIQKLLKINKINLDYLLFIFNQNNLLTNLKRIKLLMTIFSFIANILFSALIIGEINKIKAKNGYSSTNFERQMLTCVKVGIATAVVFELLNLITNNYFYDYINDIFIICTIISVIIILGCHLIFKALQFHQINSPTNMMTFGFIFLFLVFLALINIYSQITINLPSTEIKKIDYVAKYNIYSIQIIVTNEKRLPMNGIKILLYNFSNKKIQTCLSNKNGIVEFDAEKGQQMIKVLKSTKSSSFKLPNAQKINISVPGKYVFTTSLFPRSSNN